MWPLSEFNALKDDVTFEDLQGIETHAQHEAEVVNDEIRVGHRVLIFADVPDHDIERFDLISIDGEVKRGADFVVPVHSIEKRAIIP